MANDEHLALLRAGVDTWNAWRREHPDIVPDLSEADLTRTNLNKVDLRGANLVQALLSKADLRDANLEGADLTRADLGWADLCSANLRNAILYDADLGEARLYAARLSETDFRYARLNEADLGWTDLYKANLAEADLSVVDLAAANLTKAILEGAILEGANLRGTDLSWAGLSGADLRNTVLIETNFEKADLTGCRVYGISAWDLKLEGATQRNLVITKPDEPEITVDYLEVAQFIYLLLHNEKIRDAIDTIGKKSVLLLGRFTGGRLAILERLRAELRERNFVPMVFNFDKPKTKDFTETVRLLAGLSRFVIVDITNPRSAPLELQATVPNYMIPFVPIIEDGEEPFAMFDGLWSMHRDWVLEPISYGSVEELVQGLDEYIIEPALVRFDELLVRKAEKPRLRRIGT